MKVDTIGSHKVILMLKKESAKMVRNWKEDKQKVIENHVRKYGVECDVVLREYWPCGSRRIDKYYPAVNKASIEMAIEIKELQSDLCEYYGISRKSIQRYLKKYGLEMRPTRIKTCPVCKKEFEATNRSTRVNCSKACYDVILGTGLGSYNKSDVKKQKQKYLAEARKVIQTPLKRGYCVHHLDGDITNNNLDNLFVFFDQSKHIAFHHKQRKNKNIQPHAFIDGLPSWVL